MNPFDLTGRVAIVTGANTGIGQGIAVALAEAGADVALVGRSSADETADLVRAAGRRAALVSADLSTIAPVQRVVEQTLAELGGLDILVNNAGIIRRADSVDFSESADGFPSVSAKLTVNAYVYGTNVPGATPAAPAPTSLPPPSSSGTASRPAPREPSHSRSARTARSRCPAATPTATSDTTTCTTADACRVDRRPSGARRRSTGGMADACP